MWYRVLGSVLIVAGLYSVLWGKYKEFQEKEAEEIPEPVKDHQNCHTLDIEAANNDDLEMQNRGFQETMAPVTVTGPIIQPPMVAVKAPRPN